MKKDKFEENIKCDICGYQNHKKYVDYSGICHLCGNILDGKAHFRAMMNKKLRIWKDDRSDKWLDRKGLSNRK